MSDSACSVSSHAHGHRDPAWEAQMLELLTVARKPWCTLDHPESGVSADSWVPTPGWLLLDCESSRSLQCTVRRQSHSSDKIKDYPLHTHTHTTTKQGKTQVAKALFRHRLPRRACGEAAGRLALHRCGQGMGAGLPAGTPSFVCREPAAVLFSNGGIFQTSD